MTGVAGGSMTKGLALRLRAENLSGVAGGSAIQFSSSLH